MDSELFYVPGSIRIEKVRMKEGPTPVYIAWKPDTAQSFTDTKELLRFVKWPKSTPTGQKIREWLDECEEVIAPEPNADTKMVV